jgi:hypothetical protein
MPFERGKSGNPAGMRRGTKHKLTRELDRLATKEGPAILRQIIQAAKLGDPMSRRLFVQHLLPKFKFVPVAVDLPSPTTAKEAADRIAALVSATAQGALDLDSAQALITGLQAFIAAFSASALEAEVASMREEIARLRDGAPNERDPPQG